ncbi:Ig-like domain-containing protein [Gluconobacter sp. OJB]|uniref:Ig-like domain-containing protein n=1 Tax=Gluconobacter sp. OJB TaxID=3145196 RepID=UPI0031F818FB
MQPFASCRPALHANVCLLRKRGLSCHDALELTVRLQGSAITLGSALAVSLLLSGCAQQPIVQRSVAPNPFGYQRTSAVCHVSAVKKAADGTMSVDMTVRSDDGLCSIAIQKPLGGNYASFGVNPPPSHGKAFLYNYDGKTYVDYTPATAYAGTDSFTAELIPGGGQKREHLTIHATVDATGVVVAKPPAVVAPAPTKAVTKKAPVRHTTRRKK